MVKFTSLVRGPSYNAGPVCKEPSGIEVSTRYFALGLFALGEDGVAYMLALDHTLRENRPVWVPV